MPMITLTGALRIFGALVALLQAASLALASSLTHQINRAGNWLVAVGPHFIRSQMACSSASLTGSSV